MNQPFVHLHLHTEYSLVDSVIRITRLMQRCVELSMPAVAVTDAGNLFALVKFYRAAEAAGIKPIIGADLSIALPGESVPGLVTVLVCGQRGYRALCDLLTRSYREGQRAGRPVVDSTWIDAGTPELIALSGRESPVGKAFAAGHPERASDCLKRLKSWFPHGVYLELTRTNRAGEEAFNQAALELAVAADVAAVATNDVRFLAPEDYEAHEARVAIHQGYRLNDPTRARFYSPDQYLKSYAEMRERFADIPEVLEATAAVAERATLELSLGRTVLPSFPVPAGETEDSYLKREVELGLRRRLQAPAFKFVAPEQAYHQRIEQELDVILQMGFAGYFLIVADFIAWARSQNIPVGPGRGSGAGSLVAYALGITDLDPLAYDLIFERFLNPERVSMPDFDIDFCMERRDRVIDYVAERYGRNQVAQIITYGTMAARAVVRDVGRVLGHPYGFVDKIAKLVPFELGMTLDRALEQSVELRARYDAEEDVRSLIDLARKLEGLSRNAGKHAGGVVIAPGPLTEYTPLFAEANGASPVTQLDKNDVEAIGLVKFDFLGLRTLTILDKAVETINSMRDSSQPALVLGDIPLDDPKTFDLLKACKTTAVFQLESRGMKELIGRLQPDCFEDIVALVALFRPGPLQSGMVDDFIARKHGTAEVIYPHPDLEPILKPTYGVILYQEQVMQIARVLAGYTLGGADLLRRAMGKKKAEEMARQRVIFMEGTRRQNVDTKQAARIFDLMEKFAGYGFNKSHSVAYALLAYQTAWLKAHYPAAYMAAVLSADLDHTDKIVHLIDECRRMGLEIRTPHVNHSCYAFSVEEGGVIRYGLGAIKGLGRAAVESLVAKRLKGGEFTDLDDFAARSDMSSLNRRGFEALIEAGALDGLDTNRATMLNDLPRALAGAGQVQHAVAVGQEDLFGAATLTRVSQGRAPLPEWEPEERLMREKRTLGLYLSGHPMDRYAALLPQLGIERIGEIQGNGTEAVGGGNSRSLRVAGQVMELRRIGRRTVAVLDDASGRIEISFFEGTAEKFRDFLNVDTILVVDGRLNYDDYANRWRVSANQVSSIEDLAERQASCVWIEWRPEGVDREKFISRLREVITAHSGRAAVAIRYHGRGAGACLRLGREWRIAVRREVMAALERLGGVEQVEATYCRDENGHP